MAASSASRDCGSIARETGSIPKMRAPCYQQTGIERKGHQQAGISLSRAECSQTLNFWNRFAPNKRASHRFGAGSLSKYSGILHDGRNC
jgi:hypothetical protein